MKDEYKDVHVTTDDGRSIYWPKEDMTRYAPATVCQIMLRIQQLRDFIKKNGDTLTVSQRQDLERIARHVPLEEEFCSGSSIRLHNAIKEFPNSTDP
jgi:hypothetical protein